ncbi:MAG: DUF4349 domain-containing protein [Solirubrobacterales bacterium]
MSSNRINETAQHELDVIDAIVRGGGEARPEDAALTDFALLVRNARPVPNHGEVAALDSRAQEALSARKSQESMIFKPVFAGICVLVLVGVITSAAYLSSGENATGPASDSASSVAAPESVPSDRAIARDDAIAKPGFAQQQTFPEGMTSNGTRTPGVTSSAVPREVARDTRLTLATDGAEIERLSDRVNAIVDRFGGYVASSRVRGGEGNRGRATFALMIPASQYKPAMASLSKLAHVRSRSQSSEDITTAVNSADRELDRWTRRVNRLEDQLAAATTAQQRSTLSRQISSAKSAQRVAARQVRANRARVNYVPIALTIVADETAASKDKNQIEKALDKAGKILTGIAAALIVVLAVVIPIALVVAAIWFGMRRWNRVRTTRTIDAAAARQVE